MQRSAVLALACMLGVAAAKAANAQPTDDYPQRNVTVVCPFAPGGGTDILTRMLAQELQDKLKKTFVVENRPGAGTVVAAQAVARSNPDGYTLFLAPSTTLAMGPSLYKSLPYDTQKDFAYIGLVGSAQFGLIANPTLGADTLPDLIALIKSRNGQMSYATSGAGTPHHLFMEMFLKMTGGKANGVPYRGSVAGLTDVISGQIPMMMIDIDVAMGAIREGKVKGYGVTAGTRSTAMPELPTLAEAGVPGYAASGWFSMVARAGTPRPIIDKLNDVLMTFLGKPETQDKLKSLAITPLTSTPEEMQRFVASEITKWAQVIKDANIPPQ